MKRLVPFTLALALAACAQDSAGNYSLRASLAGTNGNQPANGTATSAAPAGPTASADDTALVQQIAAAYDADAARVRAGQAARLVSQVTAKGGQVFENAAGGMVPHVGAETVTVAECETAQLAVRTKSGYAQVVYVSRLQGVVYLAPAPVQGCAAPADAKAFPRPGRYAYSGLSSFGFDHVRALDITVAPWNGHQP